MRIHRAMLVALLIGIGPVVAGCADGFDMDKLDVFGLAQKKKLPGERHALFPEGVPGVSQGIPPEYLQGNLAQQSGAAVPIEPLKPEQAQPAQTAAAEQAAEEKPKPKPKKRVAARPKPTRVNVSQQPQQQPAPAQQPAQGAAPWPSSPPPPPAQQPAQQAASPWPDQQQQAPAPWPSAPPPGTFSKQ
jgi:hypothetical protein